MNANDKAERRNKIREAIRQAALEEFASNGLNGTSTQAIAKRAGLSKPQLHYYISSKEELYEETLLAVIETWDAQFFNAIVDDDPKTTITTYIEDKIRHAIEYPTGMPAVFSGSLAWSADLTPLLGTVEISKHPSLQRDRKLDRGRKNQTRRSIDFPDGALGRHPTLRRLRSPGALLHEAERERTSGRRSINSASTNLVSAWHRYRLLS